MSFIRVAVDVPLPTLFDYRCPGATASDIGLRVRVPFGPKSVIGVIVDVGESPSIESFKIRAAGEILRDAPPLPKDLLALLRFVSEYYHHPIGEVILGALPRRQRTTQRRVLRPTVLVPTPQGRAVPESRLKRSPLLGRLLADLCRSGRWASAQILRLTISERRALKRLVRNGWAAEHFESALLCEEPRGRESPPDAQITLSAKQHDVVRSLLHAPEGFQSWLLHGITGSGKTEIYLHVMLAALDRGGQVLFLVPEIGLTPQLEARIRARFPTRSLVTIHSGISGGERAANWEAALEGRAKIVLGTRSAIFVPMPDLALIVVDEEHDTSFKQVEGLRYSARDLAVWRARQRAIPVVLGSATPALETYHAAMSGRYRIARLTERANDIPVPEVRTVAMGDARSGAGLVPEVLDAIRARLANQQQVLVYINRRGYAPVLVCSACGWTPECHRCSARLVLHKPVPHMTCHHCGYREQVPQSCARCGNVDLHPLGFGTQRIEATLKSALPQARVMRIDRDTTRTRGAWPAMRARIEHREVDILIGTQLLSKGHDFPGLGLVCILNADQSLYSTDFRASEQLFAQLIQVTGRAGRGEVRGEVLIQTQFPAHPLYQAVSAQDFDAFARVLLEERKQARLPPFVYQALLRAEATRLESALSFLQAAARVAGQIGQEVVVFDPTPATMQRLKGRERAQLLVQSGSRARLHAFLDQWLQALAATRGTSARWAIDVDPISI